jgi:hypothetical protein
MNLTLFTHININIHLYFIYSIYVHLCNALYYYIIVQDLVKKGKAIPVTGSGGP